MKENWLLPFILNIGSDLVYLPDNTSFTRDPKVALNYALNKSKPSHVPVLFTVTCVNSMPPLGTHLNHSAYSAYPSESEYLLLEGSFVFVLAVERDVKIINRYQSMVAFHGKKVTIIHMLQP